MRVLLGRLHDVLDGALYGAVLGGLVSRRPRLCGRVPTSKRRVEYLGGAERARLGVALYDPGSRPEPLQQLAIVAPGKDHAHHPG